jgi:hypothetical protein
MSASKTATAHAFLCLVLLLAGIASNAGAYGTSPEPDEINEVNTLFEVNGISLQASEEIYARLSVTPEFIMTYVGEKPGSTIDLTIGGLPSGEEHYVYVDTHDEYLSTTTGSITLSLDLNAARLIWVQPFLSTIYIGGVSDQCSIVGIRDGDTCTLTTDVIGTVEIAGDNQILDCDLHYIIQDSGGSGSGIGVLIGNKQNVEVRDCKIGLTGQSFGPGVFSWHSDNVTVSGSDFESNDSNIALSASSFCHVFDNVIFGSNARVGIGMTDDSHDNEVYDNDVTVEVLPDAMGIWHSGGVPPTLAHDNLIYGNTIRSSSSGIGFRNATDNEVYGNTIYADANELFIQESGWPNSFFHNNIISGPQKVFSTIPAELSWEMEGNFWSRSCPGDLFVPGGDSNSLDVVDSYPYGQQDAWDLGQFPGCEPPDSDGDGWTDDVDNCPYVWNPGQENVDGMGEGDACDVTAPEPPLITFPAQGEVFDHQITTVAGTAELRSHVAVYEQETMLAEGYTDDDGNFSLTLATPPNHGAHVIHAVSTDTAGNPSSPSQLVSFHILLYPPDPPEITSPKDGEIVATTDFTISGTAEADDFVTVFMDDEYVGSAFTDALGSFSVEVIDASVGPHTLKASVTDNFGRLSDFSSGVFFTIFIVDEQTPVEGEKGKLEITGISDSPDPFHIEQENTNIRAVASVAVTDGLGGNSPTHTFYSQLQVTIRDAETGQQVIALEDTLDITDYEEVDGRVHTDQSIEWDGKDAIGEYVEPDRLYTYDVDLATLKVHSNPKSKCGREPCVIDSVIIAGAGSILVIEKEDLITPANVLFVSNLQYQEEQLIIDHINEINDVGGVLKYDLHVLEDYRVSSSISLENVNMIIMIAFSPGVSSDAISSIVSFGTPVFIIDSFHNNYLHAFDVVDYEGTLPRSVGMNIETVGYHSFSIATGNSVSAYNDFVDIPYIDPDDFQEGYNAIYYTDISRTGAVVVANNEFSTVACTLSKFQEYSDYSWRIFDLLISSINHRKTSFASTDDVIESYADSGIPELLVEAENNPSQWDPDIFSRIVWDKVVAFDLFELVNFINSKITTIYIYKFFIPPITLVGCPHDERTGYSDDLWFVGEDSDGDPPTTCLTEIAGSDLGVSAQLNDNTFFYMGDTGSDFFSWLDCEGRCDDAILVSNDNDPADGIDAGVALSLGSTWIKPQRIPGVHTDPWDPTYWVPPVDAQFTVPSGAIVYNRRYELSGYMVEYFPTIMLWYTTASNNGDYLYDIPFFWDPNQDWNGIDPDDPRKAPRSWVGCSHDGVTFYNCYDNDTPFSVDTLSHPARFVQVSPVEVTNEMFNIVCGPSLTSILCDPDIYDEGSYNRGLLILGTGRNYGFSTVFLAFVKDVDLGHTTAGLPNIYYYSELGWVTNEEDADSVVGAYFEECDSSSYDPNTTCQSSLVGEIISNQRDNLFRELSVKIIEEGLSVGEEPYLLMLSNHGIGGVMYRTAKLSTPQNWSDPIGTGRDGYGPYIIDKFTEYDAPTDTLNVWHVLSIWKGSPTPYGVYTTFSQIPWPPP